jgi:hypothetical protein
MMRWTVRRIGRTFDCEKAQEGDDKGNRNRHFWLQSARKRELRGNGNLEKKEIPAFLLRCVVGFSFVVALSLARREPMIC